MGTEHSVCLRTPDPRQHADFSHDRWNDVIHAVMTFNIFSFPKVQLEGNHHQNDHVFF